MVKTTRRKGKRKLPEPPENVPVYDNVYDNDSDWAKVAGFLAVVGLLFGLFIGWFFWYHNDALMQAKLNTLTNDTNIEWKVNCGDTGCLGILTLNQCGNQLNSEYNGATAYEVEEKMADVLLAKDIEWLLGADGTTTTYTITVGTVARVAKP